MIFYRDKSKYQAPSYLDISRQTFDIIIHQTRYEKSDWLRAFDQFTIACELDMINAISAVNVCLVTKPLEVFFLRNKIAERFASFSEDELCEKCIIKQLLNSVFA